MFFTRFLATFCILIASPAAWAQAPTLRVRVVYFEQGPTDPTELYVVTGNEGEAIKVSPSQSIEVDPVALPVNAGKIAFAKTPTGGEVQAVANIPERVDEAFLFLLKKPPGQGEPYQALLVDSGTKAFERGGAFLCNLSPLVSRLTVGEFDQQLLPGKFVTLKSPSKKNEYGMAGLKIFMQEGSSWRQLKDTMLKFSGAQRYLVLTYLNDKKQGAVKIYTQNMGSP